MADTCTFKIGEKTYTNAICFARIASVEDYYREDLKLDRYIIVQQEKVKPDFELYLDFLKHFVPFNYSINIEKAYEIKVNHLNRLQIVFLGMSLRYMWEGEYPKKTFTDYFQPIYKSIVKMIKERPDLDPGHILICGYNIGMYKLNETTHKLIGSDGYINSNHSYHEPSCVVKLMTAEEIVKKLKTEHRITGSVFNNVLNFSQKEPFYVDDDNHVYDYDAIMLNFF